MADRLLLVEDDPRIRTALGLGLVDEGYEVVEAGSGEAALKLIKQGDVDVVLLDLMLPGWTASPSAGPSARRATCRSS